MSARGNLYIVATPIGNLEDMTARAIRTLGEVDLIAAEDTRHSRRLLDHFAIKTRVVSYHDHNEAQVSESLIAKMMVGTHVALISDAGTPLVSDPGYLLVKMAQESAIKVIPIPGVSAVTTALSVSGLPCDRFLFEGFLPTGRTARITRLKEAEQETRTIVYLEAPHRVLVTLKEMANVFGGERTVSVARELTKVFEEIRKATLAELIEQVQDGELTQKGEFVILVQGVKQISSLYETEKLLELLLAELAPKKAVHIANQLTGAKKKDLYPLTVKIRGKD
ncbi:MAG: 16S rRNA (cytidine(1402)-2'-O)-methyltransferase [Pseudomonadales bacterium]|jgi:16S rRNA (cytidine1402-2'-O)-methyltransferase|nr:16S rRNA (cytidine(1402)-2'-O)-methyltransferase [Pseudomonadales bacterium]MDP7144974.1 16S rRNA (cytidine(1402)-2'-O)-methyltransferase [Pseudomonadales bacterium]MDP7357156.1 16S rRNA (cytidine(1402)-2'-O)-methyltransferase [Pseudomonadales bacterium]MDP7594781.1 16S rRNA (cytidine(1402)-2'-O)-methyltransferase [Pseudomonadales bacterium]HJN50040.1 16S rRNA (cytidine(1402)-2'-O)-methyltransferase [Pseudomonadales bacterium]|tara:strand:+ start:3058 stop:3897 length:840 start_codon:yes stop_codon:yes gene_type:complete